MYSVLVLCGSLRTGSYTRAALDIAADAALKLGADVQWADLRLPLMEEHVTSSDPQIVAFRAQVKAADALLLGTPVYHDSLSGVLKNALDHLYQELADKVCAVVAVGAGRAGQGQALEHLRASLREAGAWAIPRQVVIPTAPKVFDADVALQDQELRTRLDTLGKELVLRCRQLRPRRPAAPAVKSG